MNQKLTIRSDDVLRLKIIILIVYVILTTVILFQVDKSDPSSLNQLVLQLGSVINDTLLRLK
mgnify:FL=1